MMTNACLNCTNLLMTGAFCSEKCRDRFIDLCIVNKIRGIDLEESERTKQWEMDKSNPYIK